MDGDARSKVGYGRETGENMLSSRFTAHEPDTAITIAASYAAKAFGIKTGTLAREARQLCPNVIPVQANHRLYTDYPDAFLRPSTLACRLRRSCRSTGWSTA